MKNTIINQAVAYNKDVQIQNQIHKLEKKEQREQERQEELAQRSVQNLGRALANRLAHSSDAPHKNYGPHQKRIKDAEAIDEQVRRSQGMQ